MSDLSEARKIAAELGLDDAVGPGNGEGALLAREYGMNGQTPEAESRDLEIITQEIVFYKRQAGASIIEIGKRLNEAKAQLEHGQWLGWLREKVDISERNATNFMRIAREYSKSAEIADLGVTKALALLDLQDSEREKFAAKKHAVDGVEKSVADMTGEELKKAIRERDEARMAAEQAHAELEAMKDKPVEVAVMAADEDALNRARAEAESAMRAKMDKAVEDRKKAEEKRKAAETELEEARAQLETAAKAQKQAVISGDKDVAAFEVFFGQGQELANKMNGLLLKVKNRGDGETAGKLQKAMLALSDAIRGCAE